MLIIPWATPQIIPQLALVKYFRVEYTHIVGEQKVWAKRCLVKETARHVVALVYAIGLKSLYL